MKWIGMDWIGLDWIGLDWIGLDWIGLDWNGMEWNGMEWNGMEWNGIFFFPFGDLFVKFKIFLSCNLLKIMFMSVDANMPNVSDKLLKGTYIFIPYPLQTIELVV